MCSGILEHEDLIDCICRVVCFCTFLYIFVISADFSQCFPGTWEMPAMELMAAMGLAGMEVCQVLIHSQNTRWMKSFQGGWCFPVFPPPRSSGTTAKTTSLIRRRIKTVASQLLPQHLVTSCRVNSAEWVFKQDQRFTRDEVRLKMQVGVKIGWEWSIHADV